VREALVGDGLDNVSFDAADAGAFVPEVAGFDVVVSRFGVMFFDDPTAAFTHIRSLMAPGGRLAFVCWQDLFVNDWTIVPGAAVAEVLPLPTGDDPTAPGAFAFADAERTTSILVDAGFHKPIRGTGARRAVDGRQRGRSGAVPAHHWARSRRVHRRAT
jgi:SAM-dependent methyltransferase